MRRMLWITLFIGFSLGLSVSIARAQEGATNDLRIVYVTTQTNAVLRAGPGTNWERLAVIPYSITLRATGRTLDAAWIQVAYTGQVETEAYPEATLDGVTYGWIAARLLFWTGSILELTVDGVPTVNFARAVGGLILITPDRPIYIGLVGPTERIPYPLEGAALVEATGRLGDGNNSYFWVQVKANGNFYWVSNLGLPSGSLPDASYLYAVGRLNITLRRNLNRLTTTLNDMSGRWNTLNAGQPTSCNNIPEDFGLLGFNETDVTREPVYGALNIAFINVEIATEQALARFREVCTNPDVLVTSETIRMALDSIEEAERLVNLINLLRYPLQSRDPYTDS